MRSASNLKKLGGPAVPRTAQDHLAMLGYGERKKKTHRGGRAKGQETEKGDSSSAANDAYMKMLEDSGVNLAAEGYIKRNELMMPKEQLTEKDPVYIDGYRNVESTAGRDIKVRKKARSKFTAPLRNEKSLCAE